MQIYKESCCPLKPKATHPKNRVVGMVILIFERFYTRAKDFVDGNFKCKLIFYTFIKTKSGAAEKNATIGPLVGIEPAIPAGA
jgi:hypothetical protein